MQVKKRNGTFEEVKLDKILNRIKAQVKGLDVDPAEVSIKVVNGLYDGVTTNELDNLAAETAAAMVTKHPDYSILASRIAVTNLHKNTSDSFSKTAKKLYEYVNPKTGEHSPLIAEDVYRIIQKYSEQLNSAIDYNKDFNFDYFGFKTLDKSYLWKLGDKVIERPQHMYMRVAVGIHKEDIESAIKTYNLMSEGYMTHATPTLFNAGSPRPQMSSCFLLHMEDSITDIYKTLGKCAEISKHAGGIGLNVTQIRSNGAYIKGTNGISDGIIPMLKVFNETARYVNQSGKRKGSIAIYIEPWHPDIFEFLNLRKNHGKEEMRARDLFLALWINDLFMERVEKDENWTLFDPSECPGLQDAYGEKFRKLYTEYELKNKAKKVVKARNLWEAILDSQIETGTPYMSYKDSINEKSNQKNLGTIKSSNLCNEIVEYTDSEEIAVCNLASIALPKFITNGEFNFDKLYEVVYQTVLNLNRVIDNNYYPVPETKNSNFKHRPIAIGIQGLADLFAILKYPFESEKARKLNREIFETMYYSSLCASRDLAKIEGPYQTFNGSPLSEGKFQFDLWGELPLGRYNWEELRESIKEHGVRNSLLLAMMPTASTSQILGFNECFEPFTSNIYTRRTLSGEFIIVNKYLIKDLLELNLWNEDMRNKLIASNGSVQNIAEIPADIKELYKTVWEIKQRNIIDMAADRGIYVDQTQSMNIFMEMPNKAKLSSMHFYGWKKGLKTGMYYLRTQAATQAVQFTVEKIENKQEQIITDGNVCTMEDGCVICGS